MTVGELIDELEEFDNELDVIIEVQSVKGTVEGLNTLTNADGEYIVIHDYPFQKES